MKSKQTDCVLLVANLDPLTLTKRSNVVGSNNVPCNGVHDLTNDSCDEFSTPTLAPTPPVTTFCVVADAPYNKKQRQELLQQAESMLDACEFVVHLGDIRSARNFDTCVRETYTNASLVMSQSRKPVFMTLRGKIPKQLNDPIDSSVT